MPSRKDNPDWVEKTKKRVRDVFEYWRYKLGLNLWQITFEWDPGRGRDMSAAYQQTMQIDAHWEYRQASILVWLNSVVDIPNDDLEEMVLHELCHCLVCQMRDYQARGPGRKHEELVVQQVCQSLLHTRRASYDDGRRAGRREKAKGRKK